MNCSRRWLPVWIVRNEPSIRLGDPIETTTQLLDDAIVKLKLVRKAISEEK